MAIFKDMWDMMTGAGRVVRYPVSRGDGWYSRTTGIGDPTYDRTAGGVMGYVSPQVTTRPDLIRELMRSNALAQRVVRKQVTQAWGPGLDWRTDGDPEAFKRERRRLHLRERIQEARSWGRAYGGALLWVATSGTGTPDTPLRLPVERVEFLRVLDKEQVVTVELDRSAGPRDGLPEFYTILNAGSGMTVRVHHSRVIRFGGALTDRRTQALLGGWDDSVLQCVYEAIRDIDSGGQSLSTQLQDAVQTVYKIKGLHGALLSGDRNFVEEWIRSVEMFRSNFRAIGLDADKEDVSYLTRAMKDSVEVYYALMHRVAAAADAPMTELFGMAPSGLSTDDSAGRTRWYDKIEAEERNGVQGEALDRVLEVVASQTDGPNPEMGDTLAYDWPPLETPNATEEASARLTDAQTHEKYLGLGVYDVQYVQERLGVEGSDAAEEV